MGDKHEQEQDLKQDLGRLGDESAGREHDFGAGLVLAEEEQNDHEVDKRAKE